MEDNIVRENSDAGSNSEVRCDESFSKHDTNENRGVWLRIEGDLDSSKYGMSKLKRPLIGVVQSLPLDNGILYNSRTSVNCVPIPLEEPDIITVENGKAY
ncbi:hypothetical protein TNCV_4944001 [Trichonephila clavipes]|nr:hypothetical protein TNCV_4944001 [Trichonephila clavipes]